MANGESPTTDEQRSQDEADETRLEELFAKGENLSPAELKEKSELISRSMARLFAKTKELHVRAEEIVSEAPDSGTTTYSQAFEQALTEASIPIASEVGAFQGITLEGPEGAQTAADPVMMFNGQYVHSARDFQVNGAGMDFVFVRTYKNQTYYEGPLGVNWDHNYNLYLRVEFGGLVVVRSSGELREDRYVLHQQRNYYVPPNGCHDIIVGSDHFAEHQGLLACCVDDLGPGHSYSFVLRTAGGVCFLYEQLAGIDVHRIRKIRDRFGNYLRFGYNSDNLLRSVAVNHPQRVVRFAYDSMNRIDSITTYGVSYPWHAAPKERVWRYDYDEFGDLVAVTTPETKPYPDRETPGKVPGFPLGLSGRYEYSTAYRVGELRHNLLRVFDRGGQLYLENEFGDAPALVSFNRVVRQRQGRGQFQFEYLDVVSEGSDYSPEEQPAHKTTLYERDGHPVESYYNKMGRCVMRREEVREACGFRTLVSRFRYNSDGAVIASLNAEGCITQQYYGREDFYARTLNPGDIDSEPALDPALTAEERIRFGNLLSTVRRGTKFDLVDLLAQIPGQDGFKDFFPRILEQRDQSDIIRKITYNSNYQQIESVSDPRYTASADPRAREPPEYHAQLTVYEYGPAPRSLLRRIRYPATTFPRALPDGTKGLAQAVEEFLAYDPHGRLTESRDVAGALRRRRYHSEAAGVREGFLLSETSQTARLSLGAQAVDVVDIRWGQGWSVYQTYRVSDGVLGRSFEMDFTGSGIVLYQDDDETVLRSNNPVVHVEIIDASGTVSALPFWNQTQQPAYRIHDLPSGAYTIRLRDPVGNSMSLGRADLFRRVDYEVNEAGLITALTNPRGLRYRSIVNELDQVIATITPEPFFFKTYLSYNPNGLIDMRYQELDQTIDGNHGHAAIYKYDEQDKLIEESYGGDSSDRLKTSHFYDSSDRRVKTVFPRGNEVRYRYDERGLSTAVIRGACTPDESVVETLYDGAGRRVALVDPLGHITRFAYDPLGRQVLNEDSLGNVTRMTYDKLDGIVGEYFFEKKDRQFVLCSHTSYLRDELGRTRRKIESLFENPIDAGDFDPLQAILNPDNPLHFPALPQARANGLVSEACTDNYFDTKGRLFRVSCYGVLPPDPVTHLPVVTREHLSMVQYDAVDRVVVGRDPMGNYIVTTFDANDNVVRTDVHEVILDPTNGAVLYEELFSNLDQYDELDRLTISVDSLGNRSKRSYDSRNNATQSRDPLGNSSFSEFDIFGRLIRSKVEMTPTATGDSDPSIAIVTRFSYDANGNLVGVTDPRGSVLHHDYDSLDRRIRTRFNYPHDHSYREWSYNAAGEVKSYRDSNGLKRHNRYDVLNRRIMTRLDSSELVSPEFRADDLDDIETFDYDGLGRIVRESNKYVDIEITYDSLSRSVGERLWHKFAPPRLVQPMSIAREFDILSNLLRLTYPDGRQIQYEYDSNNRIVEIRNLVNGQDYPGHRATLGNYTVVRQHYAGLRPAERRHGNGTRSRFSYDGAGRVVSMEHRGANDQLMLEIQQLYDAVGNKRLESNIRRDPSNVGRTVIDSERYKYDSAYRLTYYEPAVLSAFNPTTFRPPRGVLAANQLRGQQTIDLAIGDLAQGVRYTYQYDSSGNRLTSNEPGEPQRNYAADQLNRYERITDVATGVSIQPAYDLEGNATRAGDQEYYYNHRQQLARVEQLQQRLAQFRYDARGRLLIASYPGRNEEIYFVYDGVNVIAEYSNTPNGLVCIAQYVNGLGSDNRYQIATEQQEYWYHYNNVRSTRLLTDRVGGRIEYTYEPFGKIRATTPRAGLPYNPYLFSGRRYDPTINAYDFRTRIYRPDWGRFLQRDVKGEVDGLNLYVALGNNPLLFLDPLGTEKGPRESIDFDEPTKIFVKLRKSSQQEDLAEYAASQAAWKEETIGALQNELDAAKSPEERERIFAEIKTRKGRDLFEAAVSWYAIAAVIAGGSLAGGYAGKVLAGRLGLGAFGTGVMTGGGAGAGSDLSQVAIGKEFSWEELASSIAWGAFFGGLEGAYVNYALRGLRPATLPALPNTPPPGEKLFPNVSKAEMNITAGQWYRTPVSVSEAGVPLESLIPVSRWGRPGLQPGYWIVRGPPSSFTYLQSFKWEPSSKLLGKTFFGIRTNQFAPRESGQAFMVPPESVRWPTGWGGEGRIKGLFGQRLYFP